MARTRAQRRRQTLRILLALSATFIVLVFGREVSRSAHQERSTRQSEDLSFAAMANALVAQENTVDAQLASLLTTGSAQTRSVFSFHLSWLSQEVSSWRDVAGLLGQPVLTPDLNVTLARDTLTRARDYDVVLAYIAQALSLSGPATAAPLTLGEAQLSLSSTASSWGAWRHQLSRAPGRVTLAPLTNTSARLNIPQYVQTLAAAPSLGASRAVVIGAVQVQPAPFPSARGTLLLAPTTAMQVQVTISNLRVITQPASVSIVLTPSSGAPEHATLDHVLAPTASFAFPVHNFIVFPGEKGTLSVTLNGVPPSPGLVHSRTYALSVSPAG